MSSGRTPCPCRRRSTLLATRTTAAWVGTYREGTRSAVRFAAPNSPPSAGCRAASRRRLSPLRRCSCSRASKESGTSLGRRYPIGPFAGATRGHHPGRTVGSRPQEYWRSCWQKPSHGGPEEYWSCRHLCGGRGTGIAEEDDLGVFLHNIYLNAGPEKGG
jgi:hypothetical protein